MENYETRYKVALERAKECLQDGTITTIARDYILEIFPELKECITIPKVEYEQLKKIEKRMNILIQSFEIQKETFLYGLDLLNQKKL